MGRQKLTEERLSPAAVIDHVRARLAPGPRRGRADASPGAIAAAGAGLVTMDGSPATVAEPDGARSAAVLVGLIEYPDEVRVLLTLRAAALRVHSGQIAFPGGKIEPRDAGPLAAALREAHEEIGLDARNVELLGYLDAYFTGTGFCIAPVVVKIAPPLTLAINPAEVDDCFEVPFAFLMDQANHALHTREIEGVTRQFYAMPYEQRHIWGVTAGILRKLYERVYS